MPDRERPAVREESHLDDMRAAIRGDFERLARRRGAQELLHVPPEAPEREPGSDPVPAPDGSAEARDAVSRSWLDRLLSR